jgi:hypothetical protein
MTERPSLFRREALQFRAGQPRHGGVLRIDASWTRWSYWTVLALVAAGVAVSAMARTSETTSGRARINVQQRTFVALVPDAASSDLRRGQLVRLQLDGPGRRVLAARVLRAGVADQARLRRAGFASSSQPAMLVTGLLERDADVTSLRSSSPPEGRAVVVLRSQRILGLFLRQARGMLGTGGDS